MRSLVLCLLFLGGCATLSENECRGIGDWYQRGEQDALRGARPQIELYKQQCARFDVQPDEAKYMDGWRIGYSEFNRRTSGSRM